MISIVVPLYNKAPYIERSIKSVLNQTYTAFEILILDDGSTDNGSEIVEKMAFVDNRIKYFYHTNRGVSYTRNRGIQEAKGELICFLDADDTYEETFLEKMVKNTKESNICYCGHNYVLNNKKKKANINYREGDILFLYFQNKVTPHTNSWMIKRDLIISNSVVFDENLSWGEDMLFFSELLILEDKVVCVKEQLTNYHLGVEGSLSLNKLDKIDLEKEWIEKVKIKLNQIKDNNRYLKIQNSIENYFLPALIIYRIYANLKNDYEECSKYYSLNKNHINKFKFINGFRSLKLYFYLLRLKAKF